MTDTTVIESNSLGSKLVDNIFFIKQSYHKHNIPGDKKECLGRKYTVQKDGAWRRDEMTVKEKREMYHFNRKEKRQNVRKQR